MYINFEALCNIHTLVNNYNTYITIIPIKPTEKKDSKTVE